MKQVKDLERLDKILANNGFGTRKEVKRFIRNRTVTVNGEVVDDPDAKVSINDSVIAINGVEINIQENVYIMMNKAAGYVCSTKAGVHETVYELLDPKYRQKFLGGNISTIGRLDVDTEGLLIFTTDGDLNHRLTSPRWSVPKTYFVRLRDSVSSEEQQKYVDEMKSGIHICAEGKESEADCLPAELEWCSENECNLTICEGKFHQVKRMFSALGNEVIYLKRMRINNLKLDASIEVGKYRELTDEEVRLLDVSE